MTEKTVAELNEELLATSKLKEAHALRGESKLWVAKYEVQGRKALKGLVAKVYKHYCELKGSNEYSITLGKMKEQVVQLDGVELKINAKDAHIVVWYVFAGFSVKQVSRYASAIAKAYKDGVKADGFEAYIDANGGFDNTANGNTKKTQEEREQAAEKERFAQLVAARTALMTAGKIFAKMSSARDDFKGAKIEWEEGETFRLYAVSKVDQGQSDSVIMKELMMTQEQIEDVLIDWHADTTYKADNEKSDTYKAALLSAQGAVHNAKTDLDNAKYEMDLAKIQSDRRTFYAADAKRKAAIEALRTAQIQLTRVQKDKTTTYEEVTQH